MDNMHYVWMSNYKFCCIGPVNHEIQKIGQKKSSLHTFTTASPNVRVEPLSNDPKSEDFLGFRIVDTKNNKEMGRFRANDIVKMRHFMASLGCEVDGLFSKVSEGSLPVEATHGLWDVLHPSEDELYHRQQMFDSHAKGQHSPNESTNYPTDAPPSYATTLQQLPVGFYFPQDTGIQLSPEISLQLAFPGSAMPLYDPNAPMPKVFRRPCHDTFRPPRGPPVILPVSIGYGAEIGLQPGLQALWGSKPDDIFLFGSHSKDHIF